MDFKEFKYTELNSESLDWEWGVWERLVSGCSTQSNPSTIRVSVTEDLYAAHQEVVS